MNNWRKVLDNKSNDYRPLTFWSWNNKLEKERLKKQIEELKEAGFGGFFMHARYGLKTEYMGNDWYDAVEYCAKEAKKNGMTAWCYDENGYPSGFAGMKLLENSDYLARYLTLEEKELPDRELLCSFVIDENNKPVFDFEKQTNKCVYYIYENRSPYNVDVFNKQVVLDFIDLTHEAYYQKFGDNFNELIEGFFTDEPQYYRYGTPYSPFLKEEYENIYNERIVSALPYLFLELDGFKKYRWRYYKTANDLYTNSFIKTVYEWCKGHNCKLTGHTIEESLLFAQMWCCAGVMPFYEYEDIPGCDWLGRNMLNQLNPKQVGSVAQQLGKRQTLTESFACTGWNVNFRELKTLVDWQFANGINLLCTHLTPYSMEGGRKYDHPAHFSSVNPLFNDFDILAKYVKNLGCMMGESRELANVGIIHPIHSVYLTYNRKDDNKSVEKTEKEFDCLLQKLRKYNIPHHLIDETLLKKYGKVSGNTLSLGLCTYDNIVVPSMEQIDATTAKMLKEYISNGGKIYCFGEIPSYVSGEKANLDFLDSNIKFEDLVSPMYRIDDFNTQLSSVYRTSEAGDLLFVYNTGTHKENANYIVNANGAAKMDLISGEITPLYFEKFDSNHIKLPIQLDVNESIMVLVGDYQSAEKSNQKDLLKLEIGDISTKCIDKNILVVDMASYSFDGLNYSEPMYIEAISDILLKKHYCGNLFLKFSVFADDEIENIIVESEKMNCLEVKLNGDKLFLDDRGIFDPDFVSAKILSGIKKGKNDFVFCIDYHQSNYVFEVIDNLCPESESLVNCLMYDTELAPITLYGDFKVVGQNGYCDNENCVYCCSYPFSLSTSSVSDVFDNITKNGFPFYCGRTSYKFNVKVDKITSCKLQLKSRFLSAHIKWNDYETDLALSDSIIIPAEFVRENNSVTVTVQSSNRNRLGPHHWAPSKEPVAVWTDCFNMSGTWKNGKSELFNEEYSFVNQDFSVECYLM